MSCGNWISLTTTGPCWCSTGLAVVMVPHVRHPVSLLFAYTHTTWITWAVSYVVSSLRPSLIRLSVSNKPRRRLEKGRFRRRSQSSRFTPFYMEGKKNEKERGWCKEGGRTWWWDLDERFQSELPHFSRSRSLMKRLAGFPPPIHALHPFMYGLFGCSFFFSLKKRVGFKSHRYGGRSEPSYYQSSYHETKLRIYITFWYCVGLLNIDDGRNFRAALRILPIALIAYRYAPSSG